MNCKDFEKEFGNYPVRNELLTCKGKLHNQHDIKMKYMLQEVTNINDYKNGIA